MHEPRRCLKCQQLGATHMAAEYQQEHDTCGTCGEEHCTAECTIDNPTCYSCANCKVKGHAAWDQHCPTFVKLSARYNAKHPENSYRCFPISTDPNLWEPLTMQEGEAKEASSLPEENLETGWTTVNRRWGEERSQAMGTRGRPRAESWRGAAGSSQHTRPATGANAIAGPSNSTNGALRQTTLPIDWVPRNLESANLPHPQ